MQTGRLLYHIASGYALHSRKIHDWGLPQILCWPTLRQMPPQHVWQLHQAVYRVSHDLAFSEDEYIALNHALNWYAQATANQSHHGSHTHTVLQDPYRKGHR